jgi:Uma2 family endonuclease
MSRFTQSGSLIPDLFSVFHQPARLYEGAKIPEYWVLNLKCNGLHVFRLAGERYETTIIREGNLSPQALPGVEIDVTALLGGGA